MARPLQVQAHHLPTLLSLPSLSTTTTLLFLLASIAAISSVIISLCTSHKHSKTSSKKNNHPRITTSAPSDSDRRLLSTLSGISSKALVVSKMVSWKKAGSEGKASDEAVWKKSILMGEKCRPLDFSGQIVYDSEGNQLPEFPLPTAATGGGGGSVGGMGSIEKA